MHVLACTGEPGTQPFPGVNRLAPALSQGRTSRRAPPARTRQL